MSARDQEPRIRAVRNRSVVTRTRILAREMRASPTDAERKLWWHLRHRLPVEATHFRRQVRLGRYVVDFASHRAHVVIEVDGSQHAELSAKDIERTRFIESQGYRVLRY